MMQSLVPKRAIARRSYQILFLGVIVVLLGVFMVLFGITLTVIPFVIATNPGFGVYVLIRTVMLILGALLILGGLGLIIRALTWRQDNALGETVGQILVETLNDPRYLYIRNISKFSIGYLDAVLIGPPGVLVFRITDRQGIFFDDGGNWLIQHDKGDWRTMRWNPSREALADVRKVRQFLTRFGLSQVPVTGVIVFMDDVPLVQIKQERAPVVALPIRHLAQAWRETYFTQDRVNKTTLQRLAQLLYE